MRAAAFVFASLRDAWTSDDRQRHFTSLIDVGPSGEAALHTLLADKLIVRFGNAMVNHTIYRPTQ